jgi:hypothetical protein
MVQIKIFPVIAIQLTPLQNQAVQVDPRLKPVFHLRIFSREAKFSFVFIQLVPDGSS